jgi:hypothetical protein
MPALNDVNFEGRIALAIHALNQGQIKAIRQAARVYSVPYETLRARRRGLTARRDTRNAACILEEQEEQVLTQRLLNLAMQGFPARMSYVRDTANLLLSLRDGSTVGKNWPSNFIKRSTELKTTFSRRIDSKRAKCEDPAILRPWFTLVRNTIAKYGVLETDIYNFDETGFQMGIISTARVITGTERRYTKTRQPGSREWVTVIHGINASGWAIAPLIILKAKVHQEAWYSEGLPRSWRLALSEKGWTDDEIGFEWIQHFEAETRGRTQGRYRLLIFDGHGSHHTARFEEFCKERNILTLCMPAHSSHLLQPLDVCCFSPLKRAYGSQVESQMRLGVNHVAKEDFLSLYYGAHVQAITASNIRSGFAATGLVPLDPDRVLSTLEAYIQTPSPASSKESVWQSRTPYTLQDTAHQASFITRDRRSRRDTSNSPSDKSFLQLVKGLNMSLRNNAILLEENRQLRIANERQKRKQQQRQRTLGKTRVLSIGEGQDMAAARATKRQRRDNTRTTVSSGEAAQPRARAPPRCSLCDSLEHTARSCARR